MSYEYDIEADIKSHNSLMGLDVKILNRLRTQLDLGIKILNLLIVGLAINLSNSPFY